MRMAGKVSDRAWDCLQSSFAHACLRLCNIYLVKTGTTDITIFIQNLKRHPTTWAPLAATAIRLREARNPMLCNNNAEQEISAEELH